MRTKLHYLAICASALLASGPVMAADEGAGDKTEIKDKQVVAATTMRSSKLSGLEVRNMSGEQLGSVNDLVINLKDGKIAYVALSHGGVLGVGDKMFAVPYGQLQFKHGRDEQFFVLDIEAEKIKAAPGFDQDNWPDFADPNFTKRIDEYYQKNRLPADDTARAAPNRN